MRVIVCGSRTWSDRKKINEVLAPLLDHDDLTIVQGGARGADSLAARWAQHAGVPCEEYEADWNMHGKAAGPLRNFAMLDSDPDLVIAFRSPGESRGTDHMCSIARRRGVRVEVVENDKGDPEVP